MKILTTSAHHRAPDDRLSRRGEKSARRKLWIGPIFCRQAAAHCAQIAVLADHDAIGQAERNRGNLNVVLLHQPSLQFQLGPEAAVLESGVTVKRPERQGSDSLPESLKVQIAAGTVLNPGDKFAEHNPAGSNAPT